MIREEFRRFYSSAARDYSESPVARKRADRERIATDTEVFLARGGTITGLQYGASSVPDTYGSTTFELHIAPPTLPGSAPHDPAKVATRAGRRRYGRFPNA